MAKNERTRVSEDAEELDQASLQAVLLADSFTQKFQPITLDRPKLLLPLVNIPMINYSLAWLDSVGVEEVIVVCCAHSEQVIDYLENSQWSSLSNFSVKTIESPDSVCAGDALRLIYEQKLIRGDFVLINGDTVSNIDLTKAFEEHKKRKKKDSNAIMTMMINGRTFHSTGLNPYGYDAFYMAIDPRTMQLRYYEDKATYLKLMIYDEGPIPADNPIMDANDFSQDCSIYICSMEVLRLFANNLDYQHLRHFIKGLVAAADIMDMGHKVFTHRICPSYAARVDNFRSYDTVSKDIIQRWPNLREPDAQFLGNFPTKQERQGIYKASGLPCSVGRAPCTLVGTRTIIGESSNISNSVIGKGCIIGSNVSIEGSYVWDNVTIEDDCNLSHAIICDGVVIKSGSVLKPGVVLSFKVVVGPQFLGSGNIRVSVPRKPTNQGRDKELKDVDNSSRSLESTSMTSTVDMSSGESVSESYVTTKFGGPGEEWRNSIAPMPNYVAYI